jgi:hypothetical protein
MTRLFTYLREVFVFVLFVLVVCNCGTVVNNPGDKKDPPDTTQRNKVPVKKESPIPENDAKTGTGAALTSRLKANAPQVLSPESVLGAKVCGQAAFTDGGELNPTQGEVEKDRLQIELNVTAINLKLLFAVYNSSLRKFEEYPAFVNPESDLKIVLFSNEDIFCVQSLKTKPRQISGIQRIWQVLIVVSD